MKKTIIIALIIFIKINFVQAQNWSVSLSAKKQLVGAPHRNGNGDFDRNTFFEIGVEKSANKFFGVSTSVAYLKLSDANSFLSAGYYDTLTLNVSNKISSNIFQIKVSPFIYFKKNKNEISLRPSLGLGIVQTNQTIINELTQLKQQRRTTVNDNYTYKNKFMPCFGISLNYNYYFLENWSIGVSAGLEKLSSKKSVYDIASTDETSLAKYPTIAQTNIEEYRATEYRKFGNFNFTQIGIMLKKRF